MFTRNTSIQRRTPLLFTFLLRWSRLYYNRFIVLRNEQPIVFSGRKHISLVHQQQMFLNRKQSLIPAVLPGSTPDAPYPHSLHTFHRQCIRHYLMPMDSLHHLIFDGWQLNGVEIYIKYVKVTVN